MSRNTFCAENKCEFETYEKKEIDEMITGTVVSDMDYSDIRESGIYLVKNKTMTDNANTSSINVINNIDVILIVEKISDSFVIQIVDTGLARYFRQLAFNDKGVVETDYMGWTLYNLNRIINFTSDNYVSYETGYKENGKTVYVRRIYIDSLPKATTNTYETYLENIIFVKMEGNYNGLPINYASPTSQNNIGTYFNPEDNTIVIETGIDRSSIGGYVDIYYYN